MAKKWIAQLRKAANDARAEAKLHRADTAAIMLENARMCDAAADKLEHKKKLAA